jgi:hypothetical protein
MFDSAGPNKHWIDGRIFIKVNVNIIAQNLAYEI